MKKLLCVVAILLAATTAFAEPSSFSVVVKGKGRPMILIPGLSSPGEVWDETIAHYSDGYETHRLTLAGFAGTRPIEREFLPAVRRELAGYIRSTKLDHPIIVGHSLGGFLGFWSPGAAAEQLARQADAMYELLKGPTSEQFAAQTRMALRGMITDKDALDRVSAAAVKSDPETVALAMKELMGSLAGRKSGGNRVEKEQ